MESKVFITGGSGFIGTNLVDLLLEKGYSIINFDKQAPIRKEHLSFWKEGNIMNAVQIEEAMKASNPDIVIHLAARTDTLSDLLSDYDENITGTQNVLDAIKKTPGVNRSIITSTQYVYKSDDKVFPSSDIDFKPHTIYGQSKVLTEEFTRKADLQGVWAIVRPTNIWGPWHMRYPNELWKVIDKGIYYHPVKHDVIRTYGYVKNIVHQIYGIMVADESIVHKRMFYVGDVAIDSYEWLNEWSVQLTGKPVKRIPKFIFQTVALGGDVLRKFKIPFPLYSKRFHNMIEDYPAPTDITIELFGVAESDIKKNVAESIKWLKTDGKQFFDYWKNK